MKAHKATIKGKCDETWTKAREAPIAKEQIVMRYKKKCYETWTPARLNFKLQGAILNVPQEEMPLNMSCRPLSSKS